MKIFGISFKALTSTTIHQHFDNVFFIDMKCNLTLDSTYSFITLLPIHLSISFFYTSFGTDLIGYYRMIINLCKFLGGIHISYHPHSCKSIHYNYFQHRVIITKSYFIFRLTNKFLSFVPISLREG